MGLAAISQWSCGATPRDINFGTDAGAGFEAPPGTGGAGTGGSGTGGGGGDPSTGAGGDPLTGAGGSGLGGDTGSTTDGAADEVGALLPNVPGPRLATWTRWAADARAQKDSFNG